MLLNNIYRHILSLLNSVYIVVFDDVETTLENAKSAILELLEL